MKSEIMGSRWGSAWWFQMWRLITMVWVVLVAAYAANNFPFAASDTEFKGVRITLGPVGEGTLTDSTDANGVAVEGSVGIIYKFRQETDPERMQVITGHLDATIEQTLGDKRKNFSSRLFWTMLSVPVVGFAIFFLIGVKRREV
ncbi:hypothetical protein MCEMSE6_02960 [Oxalobacteraceae bacterium]|jgi:hypothetical protein